MKFFHATKLTIALVLVLITVFSISPLTVLAQSDWGSDQLIEDNAGHNGERPQVAISGSNVVAVWSQDDDSNTRIYSNYSTDGGVTWHDDQLIEDNAGRNGESPQVAISGSNVVAVWKQSDGSTTRIYSNYSSDGGEHWGSDQLIEDNTGNYAYMPQVAISGSNVVAVWKQNYSGHIRIYSNYSSDGGENWGSDQLIENNGGYNGDYPQVAISGSNVVAVWKQGGSIDSIYSNYSSDGGEHWSSDQVIEDNDTYTAEYPQVAISDSSVVAVWKQEDADGEDRIYSNYSSNGGEDWGSHQLIEDNAGNNAYSPQVGISGSNVVAVWSQLDESDDPRIYSNYSTDSGINWNSDQIIEDNDTYHASSPQVAISALNVIVVWSHHINWTRIYSNYSGDGGASWGEDQLIEDNSGKSASYPQVAMDGLHAVAVWKQDDGSNNRIYSNYREIDPLIPLAAGWNLISLPLIPDDTDIDAVISNDNLASGDTTNLVMIYNYNTTAEKWLWWNGTPESTLNTMEDGKAYWIFATVADTLTIHGTQAGHPGPDYPVLAGWNMIGFTSTSAMELETYLTSEDGNYSLVYCWVDGDWLVWTVAASTLTDMQPGYGYWLSMNTTGTITPP